MVVSPLLCSFTISSFPFLLVPYFLLYPFFLHSPLVSLPPLLFYSLSSSPILFSPFASLFVSSSVLFFHVPLFPSINFLSSLLSLVSSLPSSPPCTSFAHLLSDFLSPLFCPLLSTFTLSLFSLLPSSLLLCSSLSFSSFSSHILSGPISFFSSQLPQCLSSAVLFFCLPPLLFCSFLIFTLLPLCFAPLTSFLLPHLLFPFPSSPLLFSPPLLSLLSAFPPFSHL